MYDNKVRLSQDVIQKAELIAAEWGLKNARAAVEAVFRRYCDDYLHGRVQPMNERSPLPAMPYCLDRQPSESTHSPGRCEALNELDDLLGM